MKASVKTAVLAPVGPPHIIGGVIHVQILQNLAQKDPNTRFSAEIDAPGFSKTMLIENGQQQKFKLPVNVVGFPKPTLLVEVEDFRFIPPGATESNASALAFLLVFKIVELFKITVGSVPVTARLK